MGSDPPEAEQTPDQIGPYKVLAVLGEGGMGTVYLAEQKEPMRRRVALKLIKLGMDSKEVLKRFKAERQALAMMEHDNIAKIFDAGSTEKGQPYFVMEYVKGIPLTEHCDQHKLTTRERLELFQLVCNGVQHAHHKGVTHRDLTPGNILVTIQEGKAIPKIIDFGLARAADHRLLAATIFTEQGRIIGTPGYMSPEQAGLGGQDVDTRTDVYALGAILYELLCGEPAFSREMLCEQGLLEMQRIIKEVEPEKPSTKLSTSLSLTRNQARLRRTDSQGLLKSLRGDLDLIVLKAMEKDRTRRYSSPEALAADLGRHLNYEPIEANPPSLGYLLQKFVQRSPKRALLYFVVAPLLLFCAVLLTGAVAFYAKWVEAEELAVQETVAKTEANEQRAQAQRSLREFQMVSSKRRLVRARKAEQDLYPAWPDKVSLMRAWLASDVQRIFEEQDVINSTLDELEQRALSQTKQEADMDRLNHVLYPKLLRLRQQIDSIMLAQDVREGSSKAKEFNLDVSLLPQDPFELARYARPRVDLERELFGDESQALAYCLHARNQLGRNASASILETLALAMHASGLDQDAKRIVRECLAAAGSGEKHKYEASMSQLLASIEMMVKDGRGVIAKLQAEIDELEEEVSRRRIWSFAEPAEGFLYDTLKPLIADISYYQEHQVQWVRERISWAEKVEELSIDTHRIQWEQISSLVKAKYDFDLAPQIGLVPLGRDPDSGLFEFYHLRSAADPTEIPERDHVTNRLKVHPGMGMIFVLLPGAKSIMGPRSKAENEATDDFAHQVVLGSFFLSKYELTQAQWGRLNHDLNPSQLQAANSGVHPVESINWEMADTLMRQQGLALPTEAQWEYASRAGTDSAWSFGDDPSQMVKYGNSADRSLQATGLTGNFASFDDGHPYHAPVGSFLPNAFGLHDMHGNVWEWCLDWDSSYLMQVQEGNGMRIVLAQHQRLKILRGGSFYNPSSVLESAARFAADPGNVEFNFGLRPARAIIQ